MDGLSVENLSISFGGVQALKDVSFNVRPGEIVGLIGPNGAGKTSLINCISRYYKPSSGRIIFNDIDLLKKQPYHLLPIGISRTFQELDLQPSLSVIDNLLVGQHSEIKTNILRAIFDFAYMKSEERKFRKLARVNMKFFETIRRKSERPQSETGYPDISGLGGFPDLLDVQDVSVGILPFGIKKKTDLARATVSKPKLLLLDEPAGGLGAADLDELVNLIKAAQQTFGMSILLIEHKIPLVMKLCDRVIVINFGQKIAEGTPLEIANNPDVIQAYLGTQRKSEIEVNSAITVSVENTSTNENKIEADLPKETILEFKEVDLTYGPVIALSGVSLKVEKGSITTILGGNGAGKSSLLKAISGVERISSGEIIYKNERLQHWLQEPRPERSVRNRIAHVAEGRRIFKELSIMENLRVAGYTCKDRKKVKENIEKVFAYFPVLKQKLKLADAGNLSGGQQQMLAIGQALIINPDLLLLDEPSLGLGPILIEELFESIAKIAKQEHCTIVLVEQNTEMALRYASYAYILETGFLMKKGPSHELRQDPELKKYYLGG